MHEEALSPALPGQIQTAQLRDFLCTWTTMSIWVSQGHGMGPTASDAMFWMSSYSPNCPYSPECPGMARNGIRHKFQCWRSATVHFMASGQ